MEDKKQTLEKEMTKVIESYKNLQDCNFELEIEHFNALQDLSILETQVHKYQTEFRNYEESRYGTKGEMKKLRQQNRYYEHVIDCFKHEMAVMSEQLRNLQEILNLSNRSCKEENGQLQNAVVGLQKLSQKLQNQLVDTEKKALIENQMNQLKDAKIDELQLIIGQKNADLNLHDEAINEMKTKLENALLENHELQNTIASLNSTMMQLKCNIECRNLEKSGRNTIEREKKNKKLDKLQADYRDQCEMIKSMQRELQKVKDKSKEKVKQLKRQNEELKEKLATSELTNQQLAKQVNDIKQHATHLSQSDCSREHELAKSKQIILELRQTLIELNESLAESELHSMALAEEYHKSLSDDQEQNDIYFCCRLEIALYKKLAENFKDAVIELRRRLSEVEARNRAINDELRCKEMRISDLQKRTEAIHDLRNQLAELEARNRSLDEEVRNKDQKVNEVQKKATKKERENCQCIQELTEKLKNSQDEERRLCQCVQELTEKWKKSQQEERRLCHCVEDLTEKLKESQEEERRLSNFIDNLKSEVQRKIEDRNEERQAVVNYCECNDMTSTQEDICQLKVEIKNMIQNQLALNNENDKLLKEVTALQDKIGTLEEKNCTLKQKLTKIHTENQNLKDTNKCLMRERETFCQTIRNLEIELADAKNNRDDVCAESRHVVNNVKAWLEEQKRINDKVKKKTQCYCETIEKLKQENETLLRERPQAASPYKTRYEKPYRPCTPLDCPELWLLGSQGTGSLLDSPRDSPISCTCSVEEWYSPNYRDEDETEEQAEDFLTTLEAVTQEIRDNNRKWNCNCKCQEFVVSRDKK